jgi:hypothetical protein
MTFDGVAGVAAVYVDSGVAAIGGVAAITAITAINDTEIWRMLWATTLV